MKSDGLDDLYQRGYVVHRDKTGITAGLPAATTAPPEQSPPTAEEFEENQHEFWFEATQAPIYLARGELWPAALRQAEMRDLLLTVLEWNAAARSGGAIDTWHNGHHLQEWLPDDYHARIAPIFAQYDPADGARAWRALIDLYSDVAAETARLAVLPRLDLKAKVLRHVDSVLHGPGDGTS
ncbi:aminoglycoside 6-adenylyltransferase [Saccharopolyspora indica]|uniref:aminoglycoside 6-adenylyltransferase n=1 Tax=Saccharopolyspora indica TaxID=1229659 RepID=UPI0022EABF4A|nr:aminoglycoside 6-adenylyltransferase [Saccharopolyspora indica]MDA3646745.1 aminoglycoside 6-adenylyltransferase [Saccharopolyspora indica]